MKKCLVFIATIACSHVSEKPVPMPIVSVETHPPTSREPPPPPGPQRRMVPPEAFLRAYLMWFGGLAPLDVQKRGGNLFDQWQDYLAALGLPDYAHDFPRVTQSNPMMLATLDKLAEVLCVRAAEHDLHQRGTPRVVFAFDPPPRPSLADFAAGFDLLHRTFLGYPAAQAPDGRLGRFYSLYQQVVSEHETSAGPLTADETGWVAVCTALVIHPEAEVY